MPHIDGVSTHAQDRALEYLGYVPEPEDWLAAVASIVDRRAVLMHVDPFGMERWLVVLDDRELTVIWSPLRGMIVTLPPPGASAGRHYARNVPRNGLGRAPYAENNMVRLKGKPVRLRKVWR